MEEAEREAEARRKVRRAAQMLLYQRHRLPGVRGWELRKALGKKYMEVVDILNRELDPLGMEVKVVYEQGQPPKEPKEEELASARFFAVLKAPEVEATSGLRVDDVAALAAALAYIVSRQGKAPRREVEELLREKFPKWKVELNVERFVKRGYLAQDEEMLYVGWRTRAEVDPKALLNLLLGEP